MCTSSPIVGPSTLNPSFLLFDNPIVTHGLIWQCRPIRVRPSITTLPCVIINPGPISTRFPIDTLNSARETMSHNAGSSGTPRARKRVFVR